MGQKPLVFLTGASGLVGSFIAEKLLQSGYNIKALCRPETKPENKNTPTGKQITWVEGSLFDVPWLEQQLADADYIIHAAAMVSFHPSDRDMLFKSNVVATSNLVNAALFNYQVNAKLKKLVFISSSAALGRDKNNNTITEDNKWEESDTNSWYGKTKYLSELEVWRAANEGLPSVIVNPTLILGPGDINRSSTTLFRYVLQSKKYYTDGIANYVDVRDVAEVVIQLMQSGITEQRFILSAGSIPYQELFTQMANRFGSKAPSIEVGKSLSGIGWRLLRIISWFSGKKPIITRETARSANSKYIYKGHKIIQTLPFTYRNLTETLDWACKVLLQTKG